LGKSGDVVGFVRHDDIGVASNQVVLRLDGAREERVIRAPLEPLALGVAPGAAGFARFHVRNANVENP
jgi:hypothetical protein